MITLTFQEFQQLVKMSQAGTVQSKDQTAPVEDHREKVMRPDQIIKREETRYKELGTCPSCDALVDAKILHPYSGLCPVCHEERHR